MPNQPISLVLLIVAFSSPLLAQSTTSDFSFSPPLPMVDSLKERKLPFPTQKHNVLKVNPLSLLAGQLSLFYERSLSRQTALVMGYGIGGNTDNFGRRLEPGGATYRRVTLEFRRYWMPNQLTGFYTGPYVRWSRLTVSQFVYDQQGEAIRDFQGIRLTTQQQNTIWIPGLLAGGQLIARWFCLDGFVGIQRQIVVGTAVRGNQFVGGMTSPWALRLGLSVGLAF